MQVADLIKAIICINWVPYIRVLLSAGQVAAAYHSPVCGGHLEQGVDCEGNLVPYLQGLPDVASSARTRQHLELSAERQAVEWIRSDPKVYCNVKKNTHRSIYEVSRRYFRWEEYYSRRELETIIQSKTGVDVGTLYEIIPISRGVSGRIAELEIIGSRRNLRIQGAERIRRVLSEQKLLSANFYVEVESTNPAYPLNFILHGAGKGDAVGMCEVSAGVLALRGKSYEEILGHFYRGTELKQLYR